MRIRVVRMDLECRQVVRQGFRTIAFLVEEISQVEVRESVLGINLEGLAIIALRLAPVTRIEIYRAEVDQRSRGSPVDFGCLLIGFDDLFHRSASLLQL